MRVEPGPRVQVAAGKVARGTDQRLDAADNGVIDADRQINHQQKCQQGDAGIGVQHVFCTGDARLDERLGRRQQGVVHLRVTLVDRRGGYIKKCLGRCGKTAGKKVRCHEAGDSPHRSGNVHRGLHERLLYRRIIMAGLVEIEVEKLECIAEFGNHDSQFSLLGCADLFVGQNAGAVCADLPEMFENLRQLVDGGVDQVVRGDFRVEGQQIFIGNKHLE